MEVTVSGANAINYPHMTTWEWQVGLYLFLGGLVAGLMIFSSLFRLTKRQGFDRAIVLADIVGLPFLALGMIFLWFDLGNGWNAWRFFTTFQVTSPMSWGSWILLFCMIVLFFRLWTHIPLPAADRTGFIAAIWRFIGRIGGCFARFNRVWDVLALLLGIGLGIYTGVLLSSIGARPLWDSLVLPFLFLASGMASGLAFMWFFLDIKDVARLQRTSLIVGAIELLLILTYVASLYFGDEVSRRAADILLSGPYAWLFWGGVVLLGIVTPLAVEVYEAAKHHVARWAVVLIPVLVLAGGLMLRFVVLYAGLESSV